MFLHETIPWAQALFLGTPLFFLAVIAGIRFKKNTKLLWPVVPGGLPFIGQLRSMGGTKMLLRKMEEWADTYGSESGVYEFQLMGQRFVVLCREDTIFEAMKQRPFLLQRSQRDSEAVSSFAPGLFSAEGETWRRDRRLVAPAFNHQNVVSYLPKVKLVVQRLVEGWSEQAQRRETISVNKKMKQFTCDVIALVSFNCDFNTVSKEKCQLATDLDNMLSKYTMPRTLSPIPYWKIPFVGQYLDGAGWTVDRLQTQVGKLVSDYEASTDKKTDPRAGTLLAKMVDLNHETAKQETSRRFLSRERLVGNLLTAFLAGTDTTSNTLAFCLWHLATDDTGLQEELAAEAQFLPPLADLTFEDIFQHAPRIRSFAREVLRVKGPASFIFLESVHEPLKVAGTSLPPGPVIAVLSRYVNTHPGPANKATPLIPSLPPNDARNANPHQLDPRRWLSDENSDGGVTCLAPSRTVMPFGYGARICPGKDLAEAEMLVCLLELVRTFEMQVEEGHGEVGESTLFTNQPDREIRLLLRLREDKHESKNMADTEFKESNEKNGDSLIASCLLES